jgi:hypothetical protein
MFDRAPRFCKRTNSGALPRGDIDCHRIHPKTNLCLESSLRAKKSWRTAYAKKGNYLIMDGLYFRLMINEQIDAL